MSTGERFDESISRWLEATAPQGIPGRVLEATFERTRGSRQQIGWRGLLGRSRSAHFAPVLGGAAVVVVVAAVLALSLRTEQPAVGGPIATPDPRSSFLGTWVSTSDADGGTQTMTIRALQDGGVEIAVSDTIATVCSGVPSTMTGTGRLEGTSQLVIPSPTYTCDDGSEPQAVSGPPLHEQLRNLTFVRDAQAGNLTDNFGGVWLPEVATAPSPEPAAPYGEAEVTELP